jgi:hypothetical protein
MSGPWANSDRDFNQNLFYSDFSYWSQSVNTTLELPREIITQFMVFRLLELYTLNGAKQYMQSRNAELSVSVEMIRHKVHGSLEIAREIRFLLEEGIKHILLQAEQEEVSFTEKPIIQTWRSMQLAESDLYTVKSINYWVQFGEHFIAELSLYTLYQYTSGAMLASEYKSLISTTNPSPASDIIIEHNQLIEENFLKGYKYLQMVLSTLDQCFKHHLASLRKKFKE